MRAGKRIKPTHIYWIKESNDLLFSYACVKNCLGGGSSCCDDEICLREDNETDFADEGAAEAVGTFGGFVEMNYGNLLLFCTKNSLNEEWRFPPTHHYYINSIEHSFASPITWH